MAGNMSFEEKYVKLRFIAEGTTGKVFFCLPKDVLKSKVASPSTFATLRASLLAVKQPRSNTPFTANENDIATEIRNLLEFQGRVAAMDDPNTAQLLSSRLLLLKDYSLTSPWLVVETVHPSLTLLDLVENFESHYPDFIPLSFLAHVYCSLLDVVKSFSSAPISFMHNDLFANNIVMDFHSEGQRDQYRFPDIKIIDFENGRFVDEQARCIEERIKIATAVLEVINGGLEGVPETHIQFVQSLRECEEYPPFPLQAVQRCEYIARRILYEEEESTVRQFNQKVDVIAQTFGVTVTDMELQNALEKVNADI
jgi:serine/threonine protein kinase